MTLPIEYSEVLTLVLVIFGIVGMMRGWYREGVTALFVALLAILVWRPEIGDAIIAWVNSFLRFIVAFFKAGLTFNTAKLTASAASTSTLLDPSSYRLWIVVTVAMIGVSYAVGEATFDGKIAPLGRLLGGIIGAANGFVIISLTKQYLTNYWAAQGRVVTQSSQVAIQMTNVPAGSFVNGYGIVFVLIILIAVVGLLIAGDRLNLPFK
jgi:hypothetical protein